MSDKSIPFKGLCGASYFLLLSILFSSILYGMPTKICGTCKIEKDISDFQTINRDKSYLTIQGSVKSQCKLCIQIYMRERADRIALLPKPVVVSKKCSSCKRILSSSLFYPYKSSIDGLASVCRGCVSLWSDARSSKITYKQNTRESRIRRKYGLTPQGYLDKLKSQNNLCDLCGQPLNLKKVSIDHNHDTGDTRGILHHRCNRQLSAIETPGFVDLALKYLAKYS